MRPAINPDGTFSRRPDIGDRFLGPDGEEVTVAATWAAGVVLEDEAGCPSAAELVSRYIPHCPVCESYHEPEYPHENTVAFRNHVYCATGRQPTDVDLYAHCSGLLRAAVQTATAGATP